MCECRCRCCGRPGYDDSDVLPVAMTLDEIDPMFDPETSLFD